MPGRNGVFATTERIKHTRWKGKNFRVELLGQAQKHSRKSADYETGARQATC